MVAITGQAIDYPPVAELRSLFAGKYNIVPCTHIPFEYQGSVFFGA
jgi:hypothetical protein